MPADEPMPFWRQSREPLSKAVTAERLVNWYLEPSQQNPKFPFTLYPTPGLTLFAAVGDGPIRGMHRLAGNMFVVSGGAIFMIDVGGNATELGSIEGTSLVQMASNATQVLVTAGTKTYSVEETGVAEAEESELASATYQDGYGIAVKPGSEQFWISNLDDMEKWTATDFTSADALADNIVAIKSVHRLLWAMGEESIELWFNSGNASFPFERMQGGFIEIGCVARDSVAVANNRIFWLGDDLQVYSAVGLEPVVVSTPAIARLIGAQSAPQSAAAFVYSQGQHVFYVLSFSDITLVYDVTTQMWAYRQSSGLDRWRAQTHVYLWRKHFVGDCENGNIYELDIDAYDENGAAIIRQADSAPIFARGRNQLFHEFRIDMESGVGLDGSVQGSDPQLMVQFSDDDGRTWSNERTARIGKLGEYERTQRVVSCGMSRNRSVRISVSDPAKSIVTGAWMHREVLAI